MSSNPSSQDQSEHFSFPDLENSANQGHAPNSCFPKHDSLDFNLNRNSQECFPSEPIGCYFSTVKPTALNNTSFDKRLHNELFSCSGIPTIVCSKFISSKTTPKSQTKTQMNELFGDSRAELFSLSSFAEMADQDFKLALERAYSDYKFSFQSMSQPQPTKESKSGSSEFGVDCPGVKSGWSSVKTVDSPRLVKRAIKEFRFSVETVDECSNQDGQMG